MIQMTVHHHYKIISDSTAEFITSKEWTLAQASLLERYLSEVRSAPHLNEKEEQALIKQWKDFQDISARDQFLRSSLYHVLHEVSDYEGCGVSTMELIEAGNMGLLKAVETYDYHSGFSFDHHAMPWIREAMTRVIENNMESIALAQNTGKLARLMDKIDAHEKLEKAMNTLLNPMERAVIKLKYGFDGNGERFTTEVSIVLQIPRKKVESLELSGLSKLRVSGNLRQMLTKINDQSEV